MAVALSSLRVSADMDASSYARGAAQKVAADNAMIAADKARNASLAQADAAMRQAVPGMAALSRSLLDGYGAGATFEAQIRKIGNALDRGMGLDRAEVLLDAAYRKFGLTADATAAAEQGFVSLVPAIQKANAAFETNLEVQARAAAAAQQATSARSAQQNINAQFGIGQSANYNGATFEALAAREEKAAAAAQKLRGQIDPMGSEFARLGAEMATYKKLLDDGYISTQEYEQANVLLNKRLTDFQMNLKSGATAGRVMAGEMANLGYQVNDVVTGLLLGQSPFMILAQQGGQVFQIFSASKASVMDFAQAGLSAVGRFATSSYAIWGGVAAAVGTAVIALNSYLSAQQKVNLGLLGSGRASGATNASINSIAQAGSSPTGLSMSEARELATALATTGKVANDNILPIVQMGKDISRIYGIDAADAAKMLADAFSDPSRGADELNARLGFLDAGMKRNIDNLVAQNNVYGAQKALLEGVKQGLTGVSAASAGSQSLWTALGNAISNAWDDTGKFLARNLGMADSLQEKLAKAKQNLAALEAEKAEQSIGTDLAAGLGFSSSKIDTAAVEKARASVAALTAAISNSGLEAAKAQVAQRSFLQESTTRSLLPEIADREKLNNDLQVLQQLLTSIGNDDAAGARLAQLGLSMRQLTDATAIAADQVKKYKTAFETAQTSAQIAMDAVTAFSPNAKAEIARRSAEEQFRTAKMDPAQKSALAEQAYAVALKQSTVAISEQGRVRELTANQAVDSARLTLVKLPSSIPPLPEPAEEREAA